MLSLLQQEPFHAAIVFHVWESLQFLYRKQTYALPVDKAAISCLLIFNYAVINLVTGISHGKVLIFLTSWSLNASPIVGMFEGRFFKNLSK